jgi:pyrroline-5-carboxylate reductase
MGGATIAGIYLMEHNGFCGTLMDEFVSATKRSQELERDRETISILNLGLQ